jgi:hypothetical protein
MKETEESQRLLAAHFPPDEPVAKRGAGQKPSEPAPGLTSLDQKHEAVLRELLSRPSWPPAELRAVTSTVGLMPWACVQTLNEWAQDAYADLLLEGVEVVTVNQELAKRLKL